MPKAEQFLYIAARAVGAPSPDNLHHNLVAFLRNLSNMVKQANSHDIGADLRSSQVVSLAILQWQNQNPNDEVWSG